MAIWYILYMGSKQIFDNVMVKKLKNCILKNQHGQFIYTFAEVSFEMDIQPYANEGPVHGVYRVQALRSKVCIT